jgi:hypothetical protein
MTKTNMGTTVLLTILCALLSTQVSGATVTIGPADITERIVSRKTPYNHKVTIKPTATTPRKVTKVVKIISGATGGSVTGVTGGGTTKPVDTDGDGKNDSTEITWSFSTPLQAGDQKILGYKTARNDIGATNTLTVHSTNAAGGGAATNGGSDVVQKQKKKKKNYDQLGKVKKGRSKSKGDSVSYDGAAVLSFSDDVIVETEFPGDPILGASVDLPDFEVIELSPDGLEYSFGVLSDEFFTIHHGPDTLLKASIDSITYNIGLNSFYADLFNISLAGVEPNSPFFDPSLANSISSSYLLHIESLLAGTWYDPEFYFAFEPDADFLAATNGFSEAASSPGTNVMGVPEAPSVVMMATGLFLVWLSYSTRSSATRRS